jgi:hypothetical protein
MKIAVECRSVLMQRALEKFLKNALVSREEAQILVTDREEAKEADGVPVLVVGKVKGGIQKPFTRSQLMLRLEEALEKAQANREIAAGLADEENAATLEEKIEPIVRRFVAELLYTVKEHYGEK